ncbi:MAG TPA: hypothetical protein VNO43_10730 [Candidatus Eisenbacteria bacterium]|nr:hypothetical protein [Candidatus Eisenbacteria bacterium]
MRWPMRAALEFLGRGKRFWEPHDSREETGGGSGGNPGEHFPAIFLVAGLFSSPTATSGM